MLNSLPYPVEFFAKSIWKILNKLCLKTYYHTGHSFCIKRKSVLNFSMTAKNLLDSRRHIFPQPKSPLPLHCPKKIPALEPLLLWKLWPVCLYEIYMVFMHMYNVFTKNWKSIYTWKQCKQKSLGSVQILMQDVAAVKCL